MTLGGFGKFYNFSSKTRKHSKKNPIVYRGSRSKTLTLQMKRTKSGYYRHGPDSGGSPWDFQVLSRTRDCTRNTWIEVGTKIIY